MVLNQLCLTYAVPFLGWPLTNVPTACTQEGRQNSEVRNVVSNIPDVAFGLSPPVSPAANCSFTFPTLYVNTWTQTNNDDSEEISSSSTKTSRDRLSESRSELLMYSEWQALDELLDSVAEFSRKLEDNSDRSNQTLNHSRSIFIPAWREIIFKVIFIFAKMYFRRWMHNTRIARDT